MTIPVELILFSGGFLAGVLSLFGLVWLAAAAQRRKRS